MYYGFENMVNVEAGGKFIGSFDKFSEPSKKIQELLMSVMGVCPPFSASVDGGELSGTLKINFFNEFDSRKISPEKMQKIIDKMGESGEYRISSISSSGDSLGINYLKA